MPTDYDYGVSGEDFDVRDDGDFERSAEEFLDF